MEKTINKEWELLEHTILLLEQAIDTESKVERDVKLPVLASEGKEFRQCDIVIRVGKPGRETITIIEVQARKKRVDINTFGGWVDKMESVGANRLICVSKHDFPSSIKNRVDKLGARVVLMTLKNIGDSFPPNILGNLDVTVNTHEITLADAEIEFDPVIITGPCTLPPVEPDSKFFIYNDNELSIFGLISKYLNKFSLPKKDLRLQIKLPENGEEIFVIYVKKIKILSMVIKTILTYKEFKIPLTAYSYEQNDAGVLAWMAEGKIKWKDEDYIFKIPISKVNDNDYGIRLFFFNKADQLKGFSFNQKNEDIQNSK